MESLSNLRFVEISSRNQLLSTVIRDAIEHVFLHLKYFMKYFSFLQF